MPSRDFWSNQRWRLERIFALVLTLWAILSLTRAPGWISSILAIVLFITGTVLLFRHLRRGIRRILWSLRNRLIVTYVFVGMIPVFLILVLVAMGTWFVLGQVAAYLVTTELDRCAESLASAADSLVQTAPATLSDRVDEVGKRLSKRFGDVQVLVKRSATVQYPATATLQPAPASWGEASGLVKRKDKYYEMALVKRGGDQVLLLVPVNGDTLSAMLPGLADVRFLGAGNGATTATATGANGKTADKSGFQLEPRDPDLKLGPRDHLPARANQVDYELLWVNLIRARSWDQPAETNNALLAITTRPSAVLNAVFGKAFDAEEAALLAFLITMGVFMAVEIGSILVGFSLTRTMTGAVNDLYEGTQKIAAGDFAHRIPVKGQDQLAELGKSFNSMTENLERLIVVAKEKERLQSEVEIARGVQNQLFPKSAPLLKSLELSGNCQPARMVSGDYYDFLCLPDGNVAIAIGDVAGKGIAAALLMASIQSIMRTQLTAGMASAAVANGAPRRGGSVSQIVSELNRQLYANTTPEKYATFCFGLYDDERKLFTYTNAGHLPPILLHNGYPKMLEVTGTVVGMFPTLKYEEMTIAMNAGDILIAYTDGIVEPENVYGEEFGTDRMLDIVMKYQSASSDEIIARIMEAVPAWTGASELSDDMTVVLARRTE